MTTVDRLREEVEIDLTELSGDKPAQVRYLAEAINAVVSLQGVYADKRRTILTEMRQSMSAAQIAAELGISRARVYQILRGN